MKINQRHDWTINLEEAIAIQKNLQTEVQFISEFLYHFLIKMR